MGGFGSGAWADVMTRKVHTGLCRSISVKTLKKMGVFDDSSDQVVSIRWVNELGDDAGGVNITPQVSGNGNKRSLRLENGGCVTGGGSFVTVTRQVIPITTTPCHFGGVRHWFLCPASVDGVLCENRVGKLYLPPGGSVFACRHCYDLTYESCQKSHKYDRVADHLEGLDVDNLTINQVLRLGCL
ncbi:MAG: hypothetical protein ACYS72_04690 [Planctomycetota bacterium]|jgi:hypothetical protein